MIFKAVKRCIRFPFELRARFDDWRLSRRPHRRLSICAIFKNEETIMEEWLRFHLGIGCEQFYLYDNGSTDRSGEILRPFVQKGLVTLIDWPENPGQIPAYRHCVENFARETKWIAFIDLDEFLFSPEQTDIRPVLAKYEAYAGLGIVEYFFGSSGHETSPKAPVTASFVRRSRDRISFKTIANPRWVRDSYSVHFFQYWGRQFKNLPYTDFDGTVRDTPASTKMVPPGDLRINHYWSRSIEELTGRKSLGSPDYGLPRQDQVPYWLALEKSMNEVEDASILKVIERMR